MERKKSYLGMKRHKSKEQYAEVSSPEHIPAPRKEEEKEEQVIAQTMLSIKKIETEKERKEKNRLAAKKSREKRVQYIEEIEYKLYLETMKNEKHTHHIDTLYMLLEKILMDTEYVLAEEGQGVHEIAYTLLRHEERFSFPQRHRVIIENLKYLLFAKKNPGI